MKHLSLEDRIVAEFEKEFEREDGLIDKYSWYGSGLENGEIVGPDSTPDAIKKWLRKILTTYKSALIGEIEGKLPKEVCLLCHGRSKIRHILSDLKNN